MKNWYPLPLIKALPSWLKCQFRQEVRFLGYVVFNHVTLRFGCLSNFYWRFIQGFRWIAAPLTSMLKTTGSSNLALRELETNEVVGRSGRADETVVDLSKSSISQKIVKKSKNLRGLKSYKGHRFKRTRLSTSTSSFWSKIPMRRRLLADQRFSGSGGSGARGVSSRSTKEHH